MSPKSFTFKLTVPRDPQVTAVVADIASHAVGYAQMDAAVGANLVARVSEAASKALTASGQPPLQIVVTGDAATLTFALDGEAVSANHAT